MSDTDDKFAAAMRRHERLLAGLRTIRKIARQRRSATQDANRADSFASIYRIARTLIEECTDE